MYRGLRICLAATALAPAAVGTASAQGEARPAAGSHEDRVVAPSDVPESVLRAARESAPGLVVRTAVVKKSGLFGGGRLYLLAGEGAEGRGVDLVVNGETLMVKRFHRVPLRRVPDKILRLAEKKAERRGYQLTEARYVVRRENVFGQDVERYGYYFVGRRPEVPGVEANLWGLEEGSIRLDGAPGEDSWRIKPTD